MGKKPFPQTSQFSSSLKKRQFGMESWVAEEVTYTQDFRSTARLYPFLHLVQICSPALLKPPLKQLFMLS